MSYLLAEHDRMLALLVQAGSVAEVSYDPPRCRVRVGEWVSPLVRWATLAAGEVRHWRPPSVGEQAYLVAPSGEAGQGWALVGFFADGFPANDDRPNITATDWPDGARQEYDHEASRHVLDVPASGSIVLRCGPSSIELSAAGIKLSAPRIDLN